MVLELKNIEDVKKLKEFFANRKIKKGFDAKNFCGAIKFEEDALLIQKRLRNE